MRPSPSHAQRAGANHATHRPWSREPCCCVAAWPRPSVLNIVLLLTRYVEPVNLAGVGRAVGQHRGDLRRALIGAALELVMNRLPVITLRAVALNGQGPRRSALPPLQRRQGLLTSSRGTDGFDNLTRADRSRRASSARQASENGRAVHPIRGDPPNPVPPGMFPDVADGHRRPEAKLSVGSRWPHSAGWFRQYTKPIPELSTDEPQTGDPCLGSGPRRRRRRQWGGAPGPDSTQRRSPPEVVARSANWSRIGTGTPAIDRRRTSQGVG